MKDTAGIDWDEIQRRYNDTVPKPSVVPSPYFASPCPNCGHCPHCGRGGRWSWPTLWSSPFYVSHEQVGGVIE